MLDDLAVRLDVEPARRRERRDRQRGQGGLILPDAGDQHHRALAVFYGREFAQA